MKIVWTKSALQSWQEIAQYINDTFGSKALIDFQKKTTEWENIILTMPLIGHAEPLLEGMDETYRSIVVHKHSKLIYSVDNGLIKIHAFWDTRQEPKQPIEP
ncbi:MAG: type II toxin-antitoxin system RelE/ParE family toxin [Bacteroidaceae bacterium]|nr:type II toxin-antitoxin system RelE/ParE family toxin [Bacteroidaceae bacterium]